MFFPISQLSSIASKAPIKGSISNSQGAKPLLERLDLQDQQILHIYSRVESMSECHDPDRNRTNGWSCKGTTPPGQHTGQTNGIGNQANSHVIAD